MTQPRSYINTEFNGVYDGNGFKLTGLTKPLFDQVAGIKLYSTVKEDVIALSENYNGNWDGIYSAEVINVTIDNPHIYTNVNNQASKGVFGYAMKQTAIYNCHVIGGVFNNLTGTTGGIVFHAPSSIIDSCSVENLTVTCGLFGGIVETMQNTTDDATLEIIYNCSASGTITTGGATYGGGINNTNTVSPTVFAPFRIINCHSSVDIITTGTSSYNIGGIVSGYGSGWRIIENCVFDGSITVANPVTDANIGGIVGTISNSNVDGKTNVTIMNCSADNSTLPDYTGDRGGNNIYSGMLVGSVNTLRAVLAGDISLSTTEALGDYGVIAQATLADANVINLSGKVAALDILGNTAIEKIDTSAALTLRVFDEDVGIGNINATGTVTIPTNMGVVGDVAAIGALTVGAINKTANETYSGVLGDTEIDYGNHGIIGNITSEGATIYRNTGTVGNIEGDSGTIAIGQANNTAYQGNSGTIGNLTNTGTVNIYSIVAGNIGEILTNGAVNIGYTTGLNQQNIAAVSSSVGTETLYNGTGNIGNIHGGAVTVDCNAGIIGDITASTGAATVGAVSKTADDVVIPWGNNGTIGNMTSAATTTVYRNTGVIGDIKADIITIGQTAAAYEAYQRNSGTIRSLNAANGIGIYNNSGDIAYGAGKSITSGNNNITIGAAAANQNTGNIGTISQNGAAGAVTIYAIGGNIGNVTQNGTGTVTIGASAAHNAANIGDVNAPHATVTGYSDTPFNIDSHVNTVVFYNTSPLSVTVTPISITVDGDDTVVKDSGGNIIGRWNNADTKNLTLSANCVISNIGAGVEIDEIRGFSIFTVSSNSGAINALKNEAGNITITSNETLGNIGSITAAGNATVSKNLGIIGSVTTTGATAEATMSITTNTKIENLAHNGTGLLTLSSGLTSTTSALYGNIQTRANILTVTNNVTIGTNSLADAINIEILDGVTNFTVLAPDGTSANNRQYLKLSGNISGLLALKTQTPGTDVNTIDVSGMTYGGLITQVGAGTTVISNQTPDNIGDVITANTAINDIRTNVTFSGTIVEVTNTGSIDDTLYITSASCTIYNYGNINNVVHTGNGTLTILNFGGAAVGDVNATVGAVTVTTNGGNIGDITAKGNVTVGVINIAATQTAKQVHYTASPTGDYDPGNGGNIGNIKSIVGTVTIYRNTGGIDNASSVVSTVTIGQATAAYAAYQINSGNIGDINAGTSAGVNNHSGNIATITAATSITVGAAAAYRSTGNIGDMSSGTTTAIYADGGSIGDITSAGAVTIGAATSAATINKADISGITTAAVASTIAIYSDNAEIGAINTPLTGTTTAGGTVTIGSAAIPNKANIESINVGGALTIVSDEVNIGSIKAFGAITIGAAAWGNAANIADITATGAANATALYNGDASVGDINGTGTVTVYSNDKQIGNVTSEAGGITIGAANKSADDTVKWGNNGKLGNLTASGAVTVERNMNVIGNLHSTAGAVTIGQNNATYAVYQINGGIIGNIDSGTSTAIYNNGGDIGSVTAATSITVGAAAAYRSTGNIGDMYSGTTTSIYADSGNIGNIVSVGNVAIGAATSVDTANKANIGNVTVTGAAGTSTVESVKTDFGDIEVKGSGATVLGTYGSGAVFNVTTGTGTVTVTNYGDYTTVPVVNIISKGNVTSNRAAGVTQYAIVNVVSNADSGTVVTMTGKLESVNTMGEGTVRVALGSAVSVPIISGNGKIQYLPLNDEREVLTTTGDYGLWIEDTGVGVLEFHAASAKGLPLNSEAGNLSVNVNGAASSQTYSVGNAFAQPVGAGISLSGNSGDIFGVTISGSFGGEALSATRTATLPDIINNVKAVYIPDAEKLQQVLDLYALTPATVPVNFPFVAVIPTLLSGYTTSVVTVNGAALDMTDGVAFVNVAAPVAAGITIPIEIITVYDGRIKDEANADYAVTEADAARSDNGGAGYYFVTFKPNTLDGLITELAIPKSADANITVLTAPTRYRYIWAGWGIGDKSDPGEVRFFNPQVFSLIGDQVFNGR